MLPSEVWSDLPADALPAGRQIIMSGKRSLQLLVLLRLFGQILDKRLRIQFGTRREHLLILRVYPLPAFPPGSRIRLYVLRVDSALIQGGMLPVLPAFAPARPTVF